MSVFIVSPNHIHGLLTFAIAHRVTFLAGNPRQSVTVTAENASKIGRVLLRENAAAYAERYPLESPDTETDRYSFSPWRGAALQPLEIRGGCACLDYQCNGLGRWYCTDAKRALDAIGAAAHALCPPAAKDAAWDLDDLPAPASVPPAPRGNAPVTAPAPVPRAPGGGVATLAATKRAAIMASLRQRDAAVLS